MRCEPLCGCSRVSRTSRLSSRQQDNFFSLLKPNSCFVPRAHSMLCYNILTRQHVRHIFHACSAEPLENVHAPRLAPSIRGSSTSAGPSDGRELERPALDPDLLAKKHDEHDDEERCRTDGRLHAEADLSALRLGPGDLEVANDEATECCGRKRERIECQRLLFVDIGGRRRRKKKKKKRAYFSTC